MTSTTGLTDSTGGAATRKGADSDPAGREADCLADALAEDGVSPPPAVTSLAAFKRSIVVGTRVRVEADGIPGLIPPVHAFAITGEVVEALSTSLTVLGWTDRSPAVGGQLGGRTRLRITFKWPKRASYVEHVDNTRLVWTNPRHTRDTLTILPEKTP